MPPFFGWKDFYSFVIGLRRTPSFSISVSMISPGFIKVGGLRSLSNGTLFQWCIVCDLSNPRTFMEAASKSESCCTLWTARLTAERSIFRLQATSLPVIDNSWGQYGRLRHELLRSPGVLSGRSAAFHRC